MRPLLSIIVPAHGQLQLIKIEKQKPLKYKYMWNSADFLDIYSSNWAMKGLDLYWALFNLSIKDSSEWNNKSAGVRTAESETLIISGGTAFDIFVVFLSDLRIYQFAAGVELRISSISSRSRSRIKKDKPFWKNEVSKIKVNPLTAVHNQGCKIHTVFHSSARVTLQNLAS